VVLSQTETPKSMFRNGKRYYNPNAIPFIFTPKDSLLYDTVHYRDFFYSDDSNQVKHPLENLKLNI
jgi:hypothetical protein